MLLHAPLLDFLSPATIYTVGDDRNVQDNSLAIFNYLRQTFPDFSFVFACQLGNYTGANLFLEGTTQKALRLHSFMTAGYGESYWVLRLNRRIKNINSGHYFSFTLTLSTLSANKPVHIFSMNEACIDSVVFSAIGAATKTVQVSPDGAISCGGSSSPAGSIAFGAPQFVEIEVFPASSTIKVYVEGNLVLTSTPSNWFPDGLYYAGPCLTIDTTSNGTKDVSIANLFVLDYTGSGKFSSKPSGRLSTILLRPNNIVADGWTNIGGAVDKKAALTDMTANKYNEATYAGTDGSAGNKDTFTLTPDSPLSGLSIDGVLLAPIVRRTSADTLRTISVNGANMKTAEITTKDILFRTIPTVLETAPDGTDWTESSVLGSQFGYQAN